MKSKAAARGSANSTTAIVPRARVRARTTHSGDSSPAKENTALSRQAYEAILQGIFAGRLVPGEVLNELALARDLRMSRTPITLAIRELLKDGLVVKVNSRRPTIARITRTDLQELFEMRCLLEGEAARRAASRIDRPTLGRLRSIGEDIGRHPAHAGVLSQWIDYDHDFHLAIAKASGNRRLAQDIERYRIIHRGLIHMRLKPEHVPQANAEHLCILAALEERNADRARQAMSTHIREWLAYYGGSFDEAE